MSANFLDTNIFIYLFDEKETIKRDIATALVQEALESGDFSISFQVVQETLNTMVGKLKTPTHEAQRFMGRVLRPLWTVLPSDALYTRALDIQIRYCYSFYDSLIIAAALEEGCTKLFSEDLQHGQRIERLIIENPFAAG